MPRHIDTISRTPKKPATPPPAPEPVAKATPEPKRPAENLAPADRFENLFPQPTVSITRPPAWFGWILLVLALAGLGFLGYDLANGRVNQWLSTGEPTPLATPTPTPEPTATPTPVATPTPTPTATPTPSLDKTAVSIRVLNGTGAAGAAAAVKADLEKAGFTVRTVGNAKSQTYQKTVLYYRSGKQEEAKAVQAALSRYQSELVESDSLASPDTVLVVSGPRS